MNTEKHIRFIDLFTWNRTVSHNVTFCSIGEYFYKILGRGWLILIEKILSFETPGHPVWLRQIEKTNSQHTPTTPITR